MASATAPLLVAALLLTLAGVPKVVRPANAVGALRSVGVRVPPLAVRVGGAAEAALGAAALVTGNRMSAVLVAFSYAAFSGFVVVALRRGGAVSSCGCIGRADTPPTRTHVVVTGGLALGAMSAAIAGADGLVDIDVTAQAVTTLLLVALSTWLAWLALALLPRLSTTRVAARSS